VWSAGPTWRRRTWRTRIAGLRELPGGDRLSGLRHPLLGEPDLGWLTRPAVLRGLAALGKAGLTCAAR
jgi:hypothetical protein